MRMEGMFKDLSISASGLAAERLRMGLIATNIAHAQDTDRGDGTPYRRQEAVFRSVLEGALAGTVEVEEIAEDHYTPMERLYRPGHPDADEDGMVSMPNVDVANEMVDLIIAARAYEANLMVSRMGVQMKEKALDLMQG